MQTTFCKITYLGEFFMKYYVCAHCNKIVEVIKDSAAELVCCGQKMNELKAGVTDAAVEKHVPVYNVNNNLVTVTVGSVTHPMVDNHYIEWISVETKFGSQIKRLKPQEQPTAVFALTDGDEVVSVYAYCNLHGLWKA